ncbi:hypothetical protein BA190_33765 [Labrys sp. WJW]|nr:hypothetical protein BA190_33765 [Labrys sp. WJW]
MPAAMTPSPAPMMVIAGAIVGTVIGSIIMAPVVGTIIGAIIMGAVIVAPVIGAVMVAVIRTPMTAMADILDQAVALRLTVGSGLTGGGDGHGR